jgi:glycosyltransferase involved in cell wall biosynthesis
MKISVCIPTYNRLKVLREAVTSCLDQTLLPDEIIISDDSGSEDTDKWIREVEKTAATKIRYYRNRPSLKQAANVDHLFKLAGGELLILLHDDDLLLPDAIQKLYDCFLKFPEIDAAFGKQYIISDDGILDSGKSNHLNDAYYRNNRYAGLKLTSLECGLFQQFPNDAYLIKSKLARETGYKGNAGDACDFEFAFRLGLQNAKLYFLNEHTSKYRISKDANGRKSRNNGAISSFNLVEGTVVPDESLKHKIYWLKEVAPFAISNATNLGWFKRAFQIYFSKWYRYKILTPAGIKSLLRIFYYYIKLPGWKS